jgi:Fic family protein
MIYESNSIEGNALTLRETEVVLAKRVTVSGKPLKDHLEAVNLAKAWEELKVLATPGTELTQSKLLDLHRVIMAGVSADTGGCYRDGAVRISGSNHVPPNAVKVPDLMEKLLVDSGMAPDPVTQAAKLHHGISSIHPFFDGNGRAARLAMNFTLIAGGYPPLSISPEFRSDYYAALESADGGDFATWQSFLSQHLEAELDLWLQALEEPHSQTDSEKTNRPLKQ